MHCSLLVVRQLMTLHKSDVTVPRTFAFVTAMPCHPTPIRFQRLLLTGAAAGGLGKELRSRLKAYCTALRPSDIAELGPEAEGEEVRPARLEDAAAVHGLLKGVDAVVTWAVSPPNSPGS